MKLDRFAKYAWAVLAFNIAVILWGAFVRATGSGAGCGSHWPLCNGEVIPRAASVERTIEFTHRATSGIALLMVAALVVWAIREFKARHIVRRLAILSGVFIVTESLVGAALVVFRLVGSNESITRAIVGGLHLINTFGLLAFMALTAWFATVGPPRSIRNLSGIDWLFGAVFIGMMILGASGAVAALGNTLYPATSLAEGLRQDFSSTAHFLIRLRVLHPTFAFMVGVLIIFLAATISTTTASRQTKRFASVLVTLVIAQTVGGMLNLALHAPAWMQLVHLLLADLVWIALVLLAATSIAPIVGDVELDERAERGPRVEVAN